MEQGLTARMPGKQRGWMSGDIRPLFFCPAEAGDTNGRPEAARLAARKGGGVDARWKRNRGDP